MQRRDPLGVVRGQVWRWVLVKIWQKLTVDISLETVDTRDQGEDVETFPEDTFEYGEARIVGDERKLIMGGLAEASGLGLMGKGNILGDKEGGDNHW